MIAEPQVIELPLFRASPDDPNVQRFLRLLEAHGHLTRAKLSAITGWNERQIRMLAEAAGDEVVRGQNGFCLTDRALRENLGEVQEAAEMSISQGKKMIRYGLGLKRRIHARVA